MVYRLKLALQIRECLSSSTSRDYHLDNDNNEGSQNRTFSPDRLSSKSRHACQVFASKTEGSIKIPAVLKHPEDSVRAASDVVPGQYVPHNRFLEAKKTMLYLLESFKNGEGGVWDSAAQRCYEISVKNPEYRPLYVSMKIIEALFGVVRLGQAHGRLFSVLALSTLTSHEECRARLMDCGIVTVFCKALREEGFPVEGKRGMVRALGRLAKFNDATPLILKEQGLEVMLDFLQSRDEGMVRRSLIALYFLGADKPEVQEHIVKKGALPLLESLCLSPVAAIQLEALDVCKVLARSKYCAQVLVDEGRVEAVIRATAEGKTSEIRNSAYRVLQRVCAHGTDLNARVMKAGVLLTGVDLNDDEGIKKLVDIFSTGDLKMQEQAARLVEELCETDPVASRGLSQPFIVKSLIDLLSTASPAGVAYAVNSLSHMLSDITVKATVSSEGGLDVLLKTLATGCDRAASGAAVAIEKLSTYRAIAEQLVQEHHILTLLNSLHSGSMKVQACVSRVLFYLKAVNRSFLEFLVTCDGVRVLIKCCWRGEPQVQSLCAGLLTDLCNNLQLMPDVISKGAVPVFLSLEKNSLPIVKDFCKSALRSLISNSAVADRVVAEKKVQDQISQMLQGMKERYDVKPSQAVEEALRMIPRNAFVPSNKESEVFLGSTIKLKDIPSELPSVYIHVLMLEALQLRPNHKFLELGCGLGYLLCLAAYMTSPCKALGVNDDDAEIRYSESFLLRMCKDNDVLECRPDIQKSKISDVFRKGEKYDRIVVSFSIPKSLVEDLVKLLEPEGRVIAPIDGKLLIFNKETSARSADILSDFEPFKIFNPMFEDSLFPKGVLRVNSSRRQDPNALIKCSNSPQQSKKEEPKGLHAKTSAESSVLRFAPPSKIPMPAVKAGRNKYTKKNSDGGPSDRANNTCGHRSNESVGSRRGNDNGLQAKKEKDISASKASQNITKRSHMSNAVQYGRGGGEIKTHSSKSHFRKKSSPLGAIDKNCESYLMSVSDIKICRRSDGKKYRLGEGGFGTVYKAHMNNVDEVAVKVVKRQQPTTKDIDLFIKEIHILSSLRHRNIVQFYGACIKPPNMFFVTEMMKGGDLYSALRHHKETMRWEKFGKKVALDVALGLNYLHSQKPPMMHRDLKSPNVLLSEEGNAKIADVGMVRAQDKDRVTAQPIMTPLWAAPEVMRRERTSIKADIWSYAILVWEIATGEDIVDYQPLALTKMAAKTKASTSEKGHVIAMKDSAPTVAKKIFEECTQMNPESRPAMKDIVRWLRQSP